MLTLPTYELNGQKIVKWTDVEVVLSNIKEEMRKFNTHGAKEFEQRFRDSWSGVFQRFNGETIQEEMGEDSSK